MARYRYDVLNSNIQLTCTCSKFLMMSEPVCEIRLKKICVHQVSVNSRKAGRRVFHQSTLTYHIKPVCAVKTNMPKILSEKIGPKRLCRVLFCIWILFSICGGAVAFSNKSFRQWAIHNNLTHPTWMICKRFDIGHDCWRECKQDVY